MKTDEYQIICIIIKQQPKKFTSIQCSHYNNVRKYNNGKEHNCERRSEDFLMQFD